MAIDVHEPSSRDYSTKPTSPVSTPPCRDHQHNNNQIISTITTKVHNVPPDISPGIFASKDDFQLWEDEHYEAEDRAEEAARPTSKLILLAAALDADIFAPIE